jgi:hypothetical protein
MIILSDEAPKPLTVERIGDKIVLQLHLNIIQLGLQSAKWLQNALLKAFHTKQQVLEQDGIKLLTVMNEANYMYIIGTNSRFVMKKEVAEKLVKWLETNLAI